MMWMIPDTQAIANRSKPILDYFWIAMVYTGLPHSMWLYTGLPKFTIHKKNIDGLPLACYGLLWFTYALLSVCVIISNIYDFFLLMAYYWHRKPLYFLQEFGIVYIAHVKCFNRYIVDMVDYHKWLAIISQLGGFSTWSSNFSYIQSLRRER